MRKKVIVFRLAKILERRGWSAYRLAKESGIPQPTVYRLLDGDTAKDARISLRTLDTLCTTLGVGVGALLKYVPANAATDGKGGR
jgi:DNA-binding Xre family transcriptional regulator